MINNKDPENVKKNVVALKNQMSSKLSCFTGQTGAGKSSTINNFIFNKQIKTNDISEKLNRGKHTTTDVRLYQIDHNTLIADTPGFSSFEIKDVEIDDILHNFSLFKNYKNDCKFNNCRHIHEKKCGVKDALNKGKIPNFIYDDYVKIINEISSSKERQYNEK